MSENITNSLSRDSSTNSSATRVARNSERKIDDFSGSRAERMSVGVVTAATAWSSSHDLSI